MLQSVGERISMTLLAMALWDRGVPATSLTGSQAGILTDQIHGKAKIIAIRADRIRSALADGHVVVVAGFQGVSLGREVTTLGRGGSDTTAVAIAAALACDACEIYTDVEGVYTADPRIVPSARLLRSVSYEEMLHIAATGGRVLALRSVEFARNYRVLLHVRSSFTWQPGTRIEAVSEYRRYRASAVTHDISEAKVSIAGLPNEPGVAARLMRSLANEAISVDMFTQNDPVSGSATISFMIPRTDLAIGLEVTEGIAAGLSAGPVLFDDDVGRVSVVGSGMRSRTGVAAEIFESLGSAGMNIKMITTSEIRISCILRASEVVPAVQRLHRTLGLDRLEPSPVQAAPALAPA